MIYGADQRAVHRIRDLVWVRRSIVPAQAAAGLRLARLGCLRPRLPSGGQREYRFKLRFNRIAELFLSLTSVHAHPCHTPPRSTQ
jgi:hypothetical protein